MTYQDNANRTRRTGDGRRGSRRTGPAILGVLALLAVAGFLFFSGGHGPQRTAATDHGTITSNSPAQTPAPIPNTSNGIPPR